MRDVMRYCCKIEHVIMYRSIVEQAGTKKRDLDMAVVWMIGLVWLMRMVL